MKFQQDVSFTSFVACVLVNVVLEGSMFMVSMSVKLQSHTQRTGLSVYTNSDSNTHNIPTIKILQDFKDSINYE